jgi:hypothetical protein
MIKTFFELNVENSTLFECDYISPFTCKTCKDSWKDVFVLMIRTPFWLNFTIDWFCTEIYIGAFLFGIRFEVYPGNIFNWLKSKVLKSR